MPLSFPRGDIRTKSFQEWAGGERVTLAIVFTDVAGSTALGKELREEAIGEVRRAHFAQSRKLIERFQGREIKTIGDSGMAAFKSVDRALDYSMALQSATGHPQARVRAGIRIGPMQVDEGDVFGGTVNFAARMVGAIKGDEIWLSSRAKEDRQPECQTPSQPRLGKARERGDERLPRHVHPLDATQPGELAWWGRPSCRLSPWPYGPPNLMKASPNAPCILSNLR